MRLRDPPAGLSSDWGTTNENKCNPDTGFFASLFFFVEQEQSFPLPSSLLPLFVLYFFFVFCSLAFHSFSVTRTSLTPSRILSYIHALRESLKPIEPSGGKRRERGMRRSEFEGWQVRFTFTSCSHEPRGFLGTCVLRLTWIPNILHRFAETMHKRTLGYRIYTPHSLHVLKRLQKLLYAILHFVRITMLRSKQELSSWNFWPKTFWLMVRRYFQTHQEFSKLLMNPSTIPIKTTSMYSVAS